MQHAVGHVEGREHLAQELATGIHHVVGVGGNSGVEHLEEDLVVDPDELQQAHARRPTADRPSS